MLQPNDLYERYKTELQPVLKEFDDEVDSRMQKAMVVLWLGIAAVAVGYFVWWVIFLAGIVTAVIGGCMIKAARNFRRNVFKTLAIPSLLQWAYPQIQYDPNDGIPPEWFKDTYLYDNFFDRYYCEDRLKGYVGETSIDISEIHTQRRERNKDKTTYKTLYHGVMLFADFNKEFQGRTVVLPDVAERLFGSVLGNFLQRCNITEAQAVQLENPEFEKLFSVYSTDQIEARYILTPAMMENLVKLRNSRGQLRILFDSNTMVVSFESTAGYLEPPFNGKLSSWAVVQKAIDDLNYTLGIVEMLDLNTRIWTKQ